MDDDNNNEDQGAIDQDLKDESSLKSDGRVNARDLEALSRLLSTRRNCRNGHDNDDDEGDGDDDEVDGDVNESENRAQGNGSSDSEKTFVCSFSGCSKSFGRPSRLETHLRTHTGERPFRCDIPDCGKAYARNQHLKRHLKAHEKEDSSPKQRRSRKHGRVGNGTQESKSKKTETKSEGAQFYPKNHTQSRKKLLLSESSKIKRDSTSTTISFSSSTTSFTCNFTGCRKVLASSRSLQAHMNIHGGVRFSCSASGCPQSYPTLKSLRRHERESHGPCPDPILIPDTPTESESEWRGGEGNAEYHSGEEPEEDEKRERPNSKIYSCSSCDKTFKKHWQLKTHSYDHTGVLPFACKETGCTRAFLYRCHLRRHVKQSHRLHRCRLHPECEAIFKSSLEATRHFQLSHVGIVKGRKKCPTCGKSIKTNRLKEHMRTHSEVRTIFRCPRDDCHRQFLAKKNLVAHLKTNHGAVDSGSSGGAVSGCVGPRIAEVCTVANDPGVASTERSRKQDTKGVIGAVTNGENIGCVSSVIPSSVSTPVLNAGVDVVMNETKRVLCLIPGCDGKFVSKVTRDRHVKNMHENKDADEGREELGERSRKGGNKRDFARQLAGLYRPLSGHGEEEERQGEVEEKSFVLKSLDLPSRHDEI